MRSSEEKEIIQGTKKISLDISKIRVYNPCSSESEELNKFENPTGIDKTISALFDAQFIYSDLKMKNITILVKPKYLVKSSLIVLKGFKKEKFGKILLEHIIKLLEMKA